MRDRDFLWRRFARLSSQTTGDQLTIMSNGSSTAHTRRRLFSYSELVRQQRLSLRERQSLPHWLTKCHIVCGSRVAPRNVSWCRFGDIDTRLVKWCVLIRSRTSCSSLQTRTLYRYHHLSNTLYRYIQLSVFANKSVSCLVSHACSNVCPSDCSLPDAKTQVQFSG